VADRFTLPRLRAANAITGPDGRAVNAFVQFWDTICRKIEGQETNQDAILVDLQAVVAQLQANATATQVAQQAANDAQTTADGTSASSGYASATVNLGSAWVPGPQVNLTGVVAGTLTIPGTGPQQTETVTMGGSKVGVSGEFRVVEIVSGVETTVYTGNLSVTRVYNRYDEGLEAPSVNNLSAAEVGSFSLARTSTGAVSYRLDFRRTTGSLTVLDMGAYLYVRRA